MVPDKSTSKSQVNSPLFQCLDNVTTLILVSCTALACSRGVDVDADYAANRDTIMQKCGGDMSIVVAIMTASVHPGLHSCVLPLKS